MTNVEASYLRDLGFLVREAALAARESIVSLPEDQRAFELGRVMAYHEVLSLMTQQGRAFGLPLEALALEGFNPESLLLELDHE